MLLARLGFSATIRTVAGGAMATAAVLRAPHKAQSPQRAAAAVVAAAADRHSRASALRWRDQLLVSLSDAIDTSIRAGLPASALGAAGCRRCVALCCVLPHDATCECSMSRCAAVRL